MNNTMLVWTGDDYEHHKCRADQIGTPKHVAQSTPNAETRDVQEILDKLPPLNMSEMRQSALRVARSSMGYDKFFEKYPAFHQKFLLMMGRESAPPPKTPDMPPLDIPWLKDSRLSYKREQPALQLVEDAKEVPPRG